ncbi:hypothetical protein [Falsiroseomonas oryzae]|uniref:hypothetical protein n=1 Tax=Falsiroseomonas oryzae TaxID=2766473 RepID=UPI0022EB1A66|nr:hypothetical protein [Roseomonas sp. MO-31]
MRHLFAAVLAASLAIAVPGGARAAIISGTWSFSINSWSPSTPLPLPTTGSATFSYDDSAFLVGVPLTSFVTNFGAAGAAFTAFSGDLLLRFFSPQGTVEVEYNAARVPVYGSWIEDTGAFSFDVTGGFTAAVPAPGALALFGVALLGLGAVRRLHRG